MQPSVRKATGARRLGLSKGLLQGYRLKVSSRKDRKEISLLVNSMSEKEIII